MTIRRVFHAVKIEEAPQRGLREGGPEQGEGGVAGHLGLVLVEGSGGDVPKTCGPKCTETRSRAAVGEDEPCTEAELPGVYLPSMSCPLRP